MHMIASTKFIFSWLKVCDISSPAMFAVTMEPGYNDIGLWDTSPIVSDILWYKLIPHF
jgi:hypothetical protein